MAHRVRISRATEAGKFLVGYIQNAKWDVTLYYEQPGAGTSKVTVKKRHSSGGSWFLDGNDATLPFYERPRTLDIDDDDFDHDTGEPFNDDWIDVRYADKPGYPIPTSRIIGTALRGGDVFDWWLVAIAKADYAAQQFSKFRVLASGRIALNWGVPSFSDTSGAAAAYPTVLNGTSAVSYINQHKDDYPPIPLPPNVGCFDRRYPRFKAF